MADSWLGLSATRDAWSIEVENSAQRLVLLAIAKYADDKGRAFPSAETIHSDTKLNRKTVFRALNDLKRLGCISVSKGANNRNNYSISSSTKNGTTKNGTTEIGTTQKRYDSSTKNGTTVVPNLGQEEYQEEYQEKSNSDCARKSPKKFSEKKHHFDLQTIPPEWASYCKQVKPGLDPEKEFHTFHFYFTQGAGALKLRSDRGWNQSWQGWVKRAKETPKPEEKPSIFAVPKEQQLQMLKDAGKYQSPLLHVPDDSDYQTIDISAFKGEQR